MRPGRPGTQAGFSMVEMLMTAFVLAIGILGLTMLQVMSLQSARGGQSLTTAVQVADLVMDQVELEGRLTWLNITDTALQPGAVAPVAGVTYVGGGAVPPQFFTIRGRIPDPAATDPADKNPFYTVTTTPSVAPVGAAVIGQMHDYTVRVDFVDTVDVSNAPVQRSVTITRRILHG